MLSVVGSLSWVIILPWSPFLSGTVTSFPCSHGWWARMKEGAEIPLRSETEAPGSLALAGSHLYQGSSSFIWRHWWMNKYPWCPARALPPASSSPLICVTVFSTSPALPLLPSAGLGHYLASPPPSGKLGKSLAGAWLTVAQLTCSNADCKDSTMDEDKHLSLRGGPTLILTTTDSPIVNTETFVLF